MIKKDYTLEELEQLLAEKKKAEKVKQEREQKKYLKDKDNTLDELYSAAEDLSLALGRFKNLVHLQMEDQAVKMANYGSIRTSSKGGFTLTHTDMTKRIIRRRDTDPVWDERGHKGVELVREFLFDFVKKRDTKLFEILLSFIEKNVKGELEYAKVMSLLQHEDKFTDPRWKEGLRLVKESYSLSLKGFAYDFKFKNKAGKWIRLELNFSAI
ncbi:DUF3164 family protein [Sphingobacterium spiritivorum]|uniref:DUF3164 family protein n=1 Tax=Sphingobacterium spiritivorum TaxID=258 RepID=UPI003DA2389D